MTAPGAVWVYAERHGGSFRPVSLEILGHARSVADALGAPLVALTVGPGETAPKELARYGADEVVAVDHPLLVRYDTKLFTDLLEKELREADPSVLLLGATRDGQDLAGRLAVRLRTGLTAHVTSLEVDPEKRLVGWVPGFGGGIEAGVVCPNRRPAIVTVRPGVFPAPEPRSSPSALRRVRPPLEDHAFGPYEIPRHSVVLTSQWVMHRDARFYPDPQRFDPDRWTPEARAARPKFAYFPFGGGNRVCIGEGFAWMEGILLLAALAQQWRMRVEPGYRPDLWPVITLRPRHGMPVRLEKRVTGARP